MTGAPRHSDQELRERSVDLLWEITRFSQDGILLLKAAARHSGSVRVIDLEETPLLAALETMLLRARLLADFVWDPPNGARSDDVVAADYFPAGYWKGVRGAEPSEDFLPRERINKGLAHFTSRRVPDDGPERQWDISKIALAINGGMERFLRDVPRHLVRDDVCGTGLSALTSLRLAAGDVPVVATPAHRVLFRAPRMRVTTEFASGAREVTHTIPHVTANWDQPSPLADLLADDDAPSYEPERSEAAND